MLHASHMYINNLRICYFDNNKSKNTYKFMTYNNLKKVDISKTAIYVQGSISIEEIYLKKSYKKTLFSLHSTLCIIEKNDIKNYELLLSLIKQNEYKFTTLRWKITPKHLERLGKKRMTCLMYSFDNKKDEIEAREFMILSSIRTTKPHISIPFDIMNKNRQIIKNKCMRKIISEDKKLLELFICGIVEDFDFKKTTETLLDKKIVVNPWSIVSHKKCKGKK